MCGIIYARRNNGDVNSYIWELYQNQKARGSEGFGFVLIDDKVSLARACEDKEIKTELFKNGSSEVLFHHRYPTSTPNFVEATHPIFVSHKTLKYDYYVVHNGHINNCDELKESHNKMGFDYTTEITKRYVTKENEYESIMYNDSESLAIEVALCVEKQKETIDTTGNVALIAIQVNKKTKKPIKLFYGTNGGSPLKMKKTRHNFVLSSQNNGVDIMENVLHEYDYATKEVTMTKLDIGKVIKTVQYTQYGFTDNNYNGIGCQNDEDDFDFNYNNDNYKYDYEGVVSVLDDEDYEDYWELIGERESILEDLRLVKENPNSFANEDLDILNYELIAINARIKDYEYNERE